MPPLVIIHPSTGGLGSPRPPTHWATASRTLVSPLVGAYCMARALFSARTRDVSSVMTREGKISGFGKPPENVIASDSSVWDMIAAIAPFSDPRERWARALLQSIIVSLVCTMTVCFSRRLREAVHPAVCVGGRALLNIE